MNLSIETKVAAAVAACFAVLTIGAIAQEQSQHAAAGGNGSAHADRDDSNRIKRFSI